VYTSEKITELTPEQTARFDEWIKKWVDIGLSTEPADFDAATKAALKVYDLIGRKRPQIVLHVSSPFAAILSGTVAWLALREGLGQVIDPRPSIVSSEACMELWDRVQINMSAKIDDRATHLVWNGVTSPVTTRAAFAVDSPVSLELWDQLYGHVGRAINNSGITNMGWAGFAAWATFFRDVCGLEDEKLKNFSLAETIIKNCGWTWWHENILVISDRPEVINRDAGGKLHCDDGPSIKYRDGWALYHRHGDAVRSDEIKLKSYILDKGLGLPVRSSDDFAGGKETGA
jgi:hypothetical protein